jgi:hypothetical protein
MSFLPMLVNQIINAVIAMKRIGNFLAKKESALPEVRNFVWNNALSVCL